MLLQNKEILEVAELLDCATREVTYFGFKLKVPDWAQFIATDCDGSIFAFERKPRFDDDDATWYYDYDRSCFIASVGNIRNPKDTLICYVATKPIVFSDEYNEAKCRRVAFCNMWLWIPFKYRWLAYDADGKVWAFKEEPAWSDSSKEWDETNSEERPLLIGTLTDANLHDEEKARQSKMEIEV